MKFLVDNQLPFALARDLQARGFQCQHVLDVNLADAKDIDICRYAESQDCVVISKDEDFVYHANSSAAKLRVVWVRLGNCRTPALLAAFERAWPELESCLKAGDRIVEIR